MDNKITKNYIIPKIVKQLKILYIKKEHLYLLVIILGEPVLYKDNIINLKIKPIQLILKKQNIIVNFNILLLKTDEAVLKII